MRAEVASSYPGCEGGDKHNSSWTVMVKEVRQTVAQIQVVVSSVPRRIHCTLPTIAADIQHSSFTIGIVIAAIQKFSSDYIQ